MPLYEGVGRGIVLGVKMAKLKQKSEEINVYKKYHTKIVKAWKMVKKKEFKKLYARKAFAQDVLYKDGLLFLGVGASFFDGCEETCNKKYHPVQYETYKGRIGEDEKKGYNYYKPMIKLAKKTGFDNNWSNIDITLFRETNQSILESFFQNSSLANIMQEQLNLATRMIKDVEPKIIIASNTLVRKIFCLEIFQERGEKKFKSEVKSEFCFDTSKSVIKKYGTPLISAPRSSYTGKALKKTPIFFTSMLSGQRALDLGSFDRLIWHIKHIQKHL
jgi:hypothetical protein